MPTRGESNRFSDATVRCSMSSGTPRDINKERESYPEIPSVLRDDAYNGSYRLADTMDRPKVNSESLVAENQNTFYQR